MLLLFIEQYYDELKEAERISQHNVLAIIGVFNTRIDKDDELFTYYRDTNRNGSLLLDIINEK